MVEGFIPTEDGGMEKRVAAECIVDDLGSAAAGAYVGGSMFEFNEVSKSKRAERG